MVKNTFTILDYIVFGGTLLVSGLIGIYFACGNKQRNNKDYLVADRNVNCFPLFVSFFATYLSAIAITGMPSEVFTYGIQYVTICFSFPLTLMVSAVVFLPIFYKLKVVSANEYLEKRFTHGVRSLGCFLVMLQYILYVSVVLYAPSLALESVAGIPLTATIISTGVVCTFYTTLGGMKAVIWTDVFQAVIMIAGLLAVGIIGVIELDGFSKVFEIANLGERMTFFDFNPDPRIRNTFWTLSIGGAFTAMPVWTVCQPAVQRFQAAKSISESKKALLMNIPALIFFVLLCSLDGLIIYAIYHECNIGVQGIKAVKSNDQVLPYFIIQKFGHLKGLPGLFTSCLFSGALSSASSGLNSMAAVILEDVVKKIKPDITDRASTFVSKIIVCLLGTLVVGLAFVVRFFGSMVLQLAYSISGIVGGPYLGLFFLGIMVPFSNAQGAYIGVLAGCASTFWLAVGSFIYPPNKWEAVVHVYKCAGFNSTNATMEWARGSGIIRPIYKVPDINSSLASWYSISYLWYAAIGVSFTVVVGCLFSLLFNWMMPEEQKEIDKRLLFDYKTFFQSLIPSCCKKSKYALKNTEVDENIDSIPMNYSTSKLCIDD